MKKLLTVSTVFGPIISFKAHSHKQWELIYYTSGAGNIIIDGKSFEFESDTIFIIPPNTVHSESAIGGYTNIYMQYTDDKPSSATAFSVHDTTSRDIYSILLILQREHLLGIADHEPIRLALVNTIFEYVNVLSADRAKNTYVETMKSAVTTQFTDPHFSTGTIYQTLDINPDYARRLFVREVGMTPGNYLRQARINRAKELLKQTDRHTGINDVAIQCGFVDQYIFSKVFKKVTGVSPSAWKKQQQKVK